jgi:hypothetical protein
MTAVAIFAVIAAVLILSVVYGKDSRPVERGHHRPNL